MENIWQISTKKKKGHIKHFALCFNLKTDVISDVIGGSEHHSCDVSWSVSHTPAIIVPRLVVHVLILHVAGHCNVTSAGRGGHVQQIGAKSVLDLLQTRSQELLK